MCNLLDNGVQNMIAAVTASPGALNNLKLGGLSTAIVARLLSPDVRNLTSSVSALSELDFVNTSQHEGEAKFGRSEDRLNAVGKLLESVDMLRALRFDFAFRAPMTSTGLALDHDQMAKASPLQAKVLLANSFCHLETLELENMALYDADIHCFVVALSSCAPTLLNLTLCNINITRSSSPG